MDIVYDQEIELAVDCEATEYENCLFRRCDFSGQLLSNMTFIDCKFEDCNLSLANVEGTLLRDVGFLRCKLVGLHFEKCNPFGLSMYFDHCLLHHASFYQCKLKSTPFIACQLWETDFTDADLSLCDFNDSDLKGAIFENSILEKSDFRTAYNYSFDPMNNKIKKAKFSIEGVRGLLDSFHIDIS